MSAEEIWKSSPLFQQYELIKFKEHLKNMSERTMKRKQLIQREHESFMADMVAFPPKSLTSRGYPFWDTHAACKLLEEDEISGRTATMKPQRLWKSRSEYQEFPLRVFRKHIYQLRTKRSFNILGQRFHHGKSTSQRMRLHKMAVEAVAGIIQFDYENGHPPFDIVLCLLFVEEWMSTQLLAPTYFGHLIIVSCCMQETRKY